jgi:hypothetical protein
MQRIIIHLLVTFILVVSIDSSTLDEDNQGSPSSRGSIDCTIWYITQGNPNSLLAQTPTPPCSIPSTFPSTYEGWQIEPVCNPNGLLPGCLFHGGAYACYEKAYGSTGPGGEACYDKNGNWIADPFKGAGTVDKETPLGGVDQEAKHVAADVVPYLACCGTNSAAPLNTCSLYYQKRPPGRCV